MNISSLEEALLGQLNVTKSELHSWSRLGYLADECFVNTFWSKINEAPSVHIVGDYDCDGICATYIAIRAIQDICPGKKISVRFPRRMSEGYGLNDNIVSEIISTKEKGTVILTVDNGIAAGDKLEKLQSLGYRVFLTDHHLLPAGKSVPKVEMMVDPAVKEIKSPIPGDYWCGAGVMYKLAERKLHLQTRKELMTFAGVATIADVVPLREGNWGFVRKTFNIFRKKEAPEALVNMIKKTRQSHVFVNETTVGFYLAPLINAAGRMDDKGAALVLRYLLHPEDADLLNTLVDYNEKRKEARDEGVSIAKAYIEEHHLEDSCPLWVKTDAKEGVVGLVASAIAEEYKRPAIVLTRSENGMLKGSARTYGDFDIFGYLNGQSDLFARFGGHSGAAGLSITEENFEKARLKQTDMPSLQDTALRFEIEKDEIPCINKVMQSYRPFGAENPAPVFDTKIDTRKDNITLMGSEKNHMKVSGTDEKGDEYEIVHFSHTPNDLKDQTVFGASGEIDTSYFAGKTKSTLMVDEIYDLE